MLKTTDNYTSSDRYESLQSLNWCAREGIVLEVGVRELKARASAIIREVREQRARYLTTYRGRPVALLIPLEESGLSALPAAGEATMAAWDDLVRLGEDIGREWRSPLTSAEVLSEMRRP